MWICLLSHVRVTSLVRPMTSGVRTYRVTSSVLEGESVKTLHLGGVNLTWVTRNARAVWNLVPDKEGSYYRPIEINVSGAGIGSCRKREAKTIIWDEFSATMEDSKKEDIAQEARKITAAAAKATYGTLPSGRGYPDARQRIAGALKTQSQLPEGVQTTSASTPQQKRRTSWLKNPRGTVFAKR